MVVTITENMTDVSMCESVTGWSDTISELTLINSTVLEGSYSLGAWINATLSAVEYYTISTVNMSANGYHVYIWMNCAGIIDTQANGGYRIVLYTDSSNYATFYVGGSDTHGTGWLLMCCDASASPDLETGTFDPSDVTRIGVQFKVLSVAVKQGQVFVYNVFWDAVRYGTGHTITSGASDDAEYEDIFQYEVSDNYFGVILKAYGSYIQNGAIILGGTGTETIDFVIDGEIIVFPSNPYVASDFYKITPLGNVTNPTYVDIRNSVIKSAGLEKYVIDSSGANIDTFNLQNSTLDNAGICIFQTGQTITSVVFTGCDGIDPNGATLSLITISNSSAIGTATGSLIINSKAEGELCDDMVFSEYTGATTYAVFVDASVTEFDMDNWVFDDPDNTTSYALYWAGTSGTLTINALNGTNLGTAGCVAASGGAVVVINAVSLTINIEDESGDPIENAKVAIYKTSDDTELMNELSTGLGVATEAYSFSGDTPIYWRVRKSSEGSTRYEYKNGTGTIDSNGFTTTVQLKEDPNI